jgi:hypothetical protein
METSRSSTADSVAEGGRVGSDRPTDPTPEEVAAAVVAIEQFLRHTAPRVAPNPEPALSQWKREALAEGVSRWPEDATASAS